MRNKLYVLLRVHCLSAIRFFYTFFFYDEAYKKSSCQPCDIIFLYFLFFSLVLIKMSKDTTGDEVIINCEYSFEVITPSEKKPIVQPELEMPQASAVPSSSASYSRGENPRIITIDSSSSDDEDRAVDNGRPQTPCKKRNYKRVASSDSEEGSGGKRGRNRVRRHLRFSSDSDSSSSDSDSDKFSNADECKWRFFFFRPHFFVSFSFFVVIVFDFSSLC